MEFQPAENSRPSPAGVFSGFVLKWKLDPTMRSQRFFPHGAHKPAGRGTNQGKGRHLEWRPDGHWTGSLIYQRRTRRCEIGLGRSVMRLGLGGGTRRKRIPLPAEAEAKRAQGRSTLQRGGPGPGGT